MSITDLSRAKSALIQLCAIYPGNYWSLSIEAYMAAVGIEMEGLKHDVRQAEAVYEAADGQLAEYREQIAMYQQNERAYAIREKELKDQNDALQDANRKLHNARLDAEQALMQAQGAQRKTEAPSLRDDVEVLKWQLEKLGRDVQGLMTPVEIFDAPDCFNPTCECNSCKRDRHQETIKSTQSAGYGVDGGAPAGCRQVLMHSGKAYPRSSCAICGQFSPKWKECDALIEGKVQPIPGD